MKKASLFNKRNPANASAQKLKKAKRELINTYQKEKIQYIQDQIDKIRKLVKERQSRLALQTINEVRGRKKTSRAKIKVANQEEKLQK